MLKSLSWPRLIGAILLAAVLLPVLTAQAVSAVSQRSDPATAVKAFPVNGQAKGRLATTMVETAAEDGSVQVVVSEEALALARSAYRQEPLAARAHNILATTIAGAEERLAFLELANRLNKRDLSLQGMLLTNQLAAENVEQSIATLDRILKVHPARRDEFYPLLVSALTNDATVPIFADLLETKANWHEGFLQAGLKNPDALVNLADLRERLIIDDETFDSGLIAALVAAGETDRAQSAYRFFKRSEGADSAFGALEWAIKYPPLDWDLVDLPGQRAQLSRSGDSLEIYVRGGKGGRVARRVVPMPDGPFQLVFRHDALPTGDIASARIVARCEATGAVINQGAFSSTRSVFEFHDPPTDCTYLRMALVARAWSGAPPLNFEVQSVEVAPLPSS